MRKQVKYKIGDRIVLKRDKGWTLTNCVIVEKKANKYLIATPESFVRYEIKKSDIAYKIEK